MNTTTNQNKSYFCLKCLNTFDNTYANDYEIIYEYEAYPRCPIKNCYTRLLYENNDTIAAIINLTKQGYGILKKYGSVAWGTPQAIVDIT